MKQKELKMHATTHRCMNVKFDFSMQNLETRVCFKKFRHLLNKLLAGNKSYRRRGTIYQILRTKH